MSKPMNKWLHKILCLIFVATLPACDKISIPRLSFDDEPETKVPISVMYHFDPSLLQHTQVVDACGLPYTIKSGNIIAQTFTRIGQERFASVATQPTDPASGISPSLSNDLTIDLRFVDASFEPIGRSGEEDRYHANVGLQLQAIYRDSQGNALAKTPLTYADKVNLWTPALTGQSNSCATGQFDGVIESAAETLAMDMVNVIPRLYGQAPEPQGPANTSPVTPFSTQPTQSQQPSLTFRTMLQDENNNLILEGGENLVLQIETTNMSATPVRSAYVELRGSQTIIDAFSDVITLPIPIGALQPGEKKTTEVRGRMPASVEQEKGELVVSISLSQGIPPGEHTVLAAIQPATTTPPQVHKDKKPSHTTSSTNSPYHALVVGMNEYRDPWPKAYQVPKQQLREVTDALRVTGTFPRENIKVLNGPHATRADIEESLFDLAKHRLSPDSIFVLYFAGHAFIDPAEGEVYLVPFEGSLSASKKRLISLRSLQRVLHKLKVKLSVLFLDTPVTQYLESSKTAVGLNGSTPANWQAMLPLNGKPHVPQVIQVRRLEGKSTSAPVQLLEGLRGSADQNQNGIVTLEELLQDLDGTAEIIPAQSLTPPYSNIPLAR